MSLLILIAILMVGGLLAWWSERWGEHWPRWTSLLALALACIQLLQLSDSQTSGLWWYYDSLPWVARFGIHFEVGLDGLSAILLWLTLLLGFFSVLVSWTEVSQRIGFFSLQSIGYPRRGSWRFCRPRFVFVFCFLGSDVAADGGVNCYLGV